MNQKQAKTNEQLAAEKAVIDGLRDELRSLCNKVPPRVLSGSYQVAVSWKESAIDSLRLANSKSPTEEKLRNAIGRMSHGGRA